MMIMVFSLFLKQSSEGRVIDSSATDVALGENLDFLLHFLCLPFIICQKRVGVVFPPLWKYFGSLHFSLS